MLGLGYPGGPMIEKMAEIGDENRFVLPHPLKNSNDCNLSFSGLKTAVRKIIESYDESGNIEHVILSKKDTAPPAGKTGGRKRPAFCRAAAQMVYRQRGDDRLGGAGALCQRAERRAGLQTAAALAA